MMEVLIALSLPIVALLIVLLIGMGVASAFIVAADAARDTTR